MEVESNKADVKMEDEEGSANKVQNWDIKIEVEGKNYKGDDVISRDFMGRIRKI